MWLASGLAALLPTNRLMYSILQVGGGYCCVKFCVAGVLVACCNQHHPSLTIC